MDPIAIVRLVLIGLLPPAFAVGFYFLERTRFFGGLKTIWKQVIAGVAFGGVACLATEFGSNFNGAVLNVRDAAAVTAGLLYGLPAGLVAGFIGGVERFASAYWNNTFYTQWACSISTFISGLTAGFLRRYVFANKRPIWPLALLVGLLTETFHMVMIFLTNVSDPTNAFETVRLLGNKMITANMLSATLAILILQIIDFAKRDKSIPREKHKRLPVRGHLALRLSIIGTLAISISGILTFGFQSSASYTNSVSLLKLNVEDAVSDILDTSDGTILSLARNLASLAEKLDHAPDNADLESMLPASGVSEIHYVNEDGIIVASTVGSSLGFDMNTGDGQAKEFVERLADYPSEFVQAYMPTSQDASVKKKFAGIALSRGGFLQVAFTSEKFYASLEEIVSQVVQNRHIGEKGYMLVCDESYIILSRNPGLDDRTLAEFGFPMRFDPKDQMVRQTADIRYVSTFEYVPSYYMYAAAEGYYIIGVVDVAEMLLSRDQATFLGVYLMIIIFSSLFIMVYASVDRLVLRDLTEVNDKLAKIASGDLEQKLDSRRTTEMNQLTSSINSTVDALKGYIAHEASRYDEELALGKQIQLSSLPSKLSYLRRHEFDIYGNMVTAKQVGGDFYDYFMLADKRVAFVVADVSGKGIPAALFMMKTKSVVKALAENGLSVEDIFQRANERLCEGNETDTFVTAWMGICDLSTGVVEFVNAGHNPPLAKIDGKFSYLTMKRDLVLGAMKDAPYHKQTLKLSPRDMLFLYTDGVTEAESAPETFFGEQRLLDLLNNGTTTRDPEKICGMVNDAVSDFVGKHVQSDDITMVCFSYYGASKDTHFEFEPNAEAVGELCDKVSVALEEEGMNLVMINKVNLIVEEAAANIAFHAYEKKKGVGKLDVSISEAQIVLTFFDSGPHFDPLAKEDPNIHLSAEERPIGGLGIFMIKKLADKVYYSYQERQNILTVIINR